MRRFLFICPFALLGLAACREDIELDLAAGPPRVAIDARLWARANSQAPHGAVAITRSAAPTGQPEIDWVTDAQVVIWDNANQRDTLEYIPLYVIDGQMPNGLPKVSGMDWGSLPLEAGAYVTHTLQAIPGRTYFIRVTLPTGEVFEAQSELPVPVPIDSISYVWETVGIRPNEGFWVSYHYQDPPEAGNRYLSFHYQNRVLQNNPASIDVFSDNLGNGNDIAHRVPHAFAPNDTVLVEHHTVTPAVHAYWRGYLEIVSQGGGPFDAPGANPPTNFTGGALGLFWCSAPQRMRVVVQ